jgi:A/G-specific adenine glycosylase
MFSPSASQVRDFQNTVFQRYDLHRRSLPWRETTDPYSIWISEVMSQQTQVDRVLSYYDRFLQVYPTVFDLKDASSTDILRLWSGLGYNSRGLRLIQCARIVVDQFGGEFPREEFQLLTLPGIGPYTARALQAFARNMEVPVIDTNIRRVLIAFFGLDEQISVSDLENFAFSCIPI